VDARGGRPAPAQLRLEALVTGGTGMDENEAKLLADLCDMAADVIEEFPAVAAKVARRLAVSIRGLKTEAVA
jgi:hypothetical protein